jgi:hypothetical protein
MLNPASHGACRHCNKTIALVTPWTKTCDSCAELSRLEKLPHQIAGRNARIASWMEKKRRERGDKLFKGVEIGCGRCKRPFVTRGIAHKYCDSCQPAVHLEASRRNEARRKRPGRIKVGSSIACRGCGGTFVKVGVHQAFCTEVCKNHHWARNASWIIGRRISASMNACLRRGGSTKSHRPWESLVGYTLADLMRHLERQFRGKMSWKNRDKWHIDHILPLSSFKFTSADDPEFRAAWALTNLRPLWKPANLSKSSKRTLLL